MLRIQIDDGCAKGLFAGEVIVEGAFGYTRLVGALLDARAVVSLAQKQIETRGEQALGDGGWVGRTRHRARNMTGRLEPVSGQEGFTMEATSPSSMKISTNTAWLRGGAPDAVASVALMDPVTELPPDGRIEISLLGGFRIRIGPSLLHLPTRKAQALVAYLALTPGRVHDRERIHALLWPESGKVQAQASLRQALLTIRRSLSSHAPHALRSSDATIALDDSQVQVDVTTLERSVADATHEALERITSVCVGPFLEGFAAGSAPFDEWIASERARLQELVGEGLERLAELQAQAGRVDRAIQTTLHSLRLEPLQERTHRALMRLYAMHGRRAEAVQQYATCAATLERELGVEPEEQTKQLHRDLLRESVAIRAAPRAPTVARPRPVLIGRDAEIRGLDKALEEAWTGSSRLVLLRGDAGVGKTRLLEAMACKAAERGGVDIRGRCFESERVLPFALWADLLRSEPASWDEALGPMSSASRAEISRILPRVGEPAAPPPPSSNDARALFEAAASCSRAWRSGPP